MGFMIRQKSALSPFAAPGTAEYTEATASYNMSAQPAPVAPWWPRRPGTSYGLSGLPIA